MFTLRIRREVIRSPSWISSLVSFNRAVNKRFGRLESHVVTLARSVAHLSSELRSQASLSQDVDDMRRQVQDQQLKTKEEGDPAKESAQLQSRVKKLKRYFLTVYFYIGLFQPWNIKSFKTNFAVYTNIPVRPVSLFPSPPLPSLLHFPSWLDSISWGDERIQNQWDKFGHFRKADLFELEKVSY